MGHRRHAPRRGVRTEVLARIGHEPEVEREVRGPPQFPTRPSDGEYAQRQEVDGEDPGDAAR